MIRLVLLAAAACAPAAAQTISFLQSSQNGQPAQNVTTITSGSNLPGGFTLYINGTFTVGGPPTTVAWTNISGGLSNNSLVPFSITAGQIQVIIPVDLFKTVVTSTQAVNVTVTQGLSTSKPASFSVVPPPSGVGPLPNAFVGSPYATPIVQNGTPPYTLSTMLGAPPPGINFNASFTGLAGTPLGPPGLDSFQPTIVDFWNNLIALPLNIQVIGTPTVSKVNSSAGISYSYGAFTNLSVTVLPAPAIPAFAANVQFKDGATVLGSAAITPASGLAAISGVFLATGGHSITATFLGDANWQAAASPALGVTVTQATPTLVLQPAFAGSYGGTMSSGTVSVVGAGGEAAAPTGFLRLSSGATVIATFGVSGGVMPLSGTPLPPALNAGVQPLTLSYLGDTNYAATNAANSITIAQVLPTVALTLNPNPVGFLQNENMTLMVKTPTTGTPGGTVTFFNGGSPIPGGTVSLSGGAGTFNISTLAIGAYPISAVYNGDINFAPNETPAQTLTVIIAPLAFSTTTLPGGTAYAPYGATVVVTGGVPPYNIAVTGLPSGLNLNSLTGVISGTPLASGTFTPTFTATDSAASISSGTPTGKVTAQITLTISGPPLRISTETLPNGVVGVGYSAAVGTVGGVSPISISLAGGTVPPGLTFNNSLLSGTPTTAGTYTITLRAVDANNVSDSRDYTVTIKPPPLSIPGPPNPAGTTGTPLNINLGCTGGVGPYTFSVTGSLPPGVTFANCTLSGTPTATGVFLIHITITDSTGASVTKDITITVSSPVFTFTGGALPNGQVGVAYTANVSATGGSGTTTYSGGVGLPDGLSLSSSGAITGTPTKDGSFSFQVTATQPSVTADVSKPGITATFNITVVPATLAFGPASLPDGVVGVAYSGSVSGTGGVKPYSFSASGLPDGLSATTAGAVGGTPTAPGTFTVTATVTDAAGGHATQAYTIKIAPAPLVIPTASAPNGTLGIAYSANFTATGGAGPYTFSSTGQPSTLTMSAGGTLSGTPAAPGAISITVTVKDSTGTTATKAFTFTIVLPPAPPLNFGGIPATVNPLQQPRITVSLASPFPVDVVVTLTLTSQPDSGPVDPAVAFIGGGNTATITIPAGSLNGATDVGVQTGSVAGTITITAKLTASGVDVTPSPAPSRSIRIAAGAPVLVTVTATRTATGFTISSIGYVTDREITTGNFTFSGTNLGTTSLTIPVDTMFSGYFGGNSPPSAPFGGQFSYNQQFTVNGSNTSVTSVTVTLTNKIGTSNTVTVNLQ